MLEADNAENEGKADDPLDIRGNPEVDNPVEATCKAPVAVVPAHTGAYAVVIVVTPVPPPATTAVVYDGLLAEPCDTNGIPEVAEGATLDNVLVVAPPT